MQTSGPPRQYRKLFDGEVRKNAVIISRSKGPIAWSGGKGTGKAPPEDAVKQ